MNWKAKKQLVIPALACLLGYALAWSMTRKFGTHQIEDVTLDWVLQENGISRGNVHVQRYQGALNATSKTEGFKLFKAEASSPAPFFVICEYFVSSRPHEATSHRSIHLWFLGRSWRLDTAMTGMS